MSQTKKTDLILRNARLIDGTGASSQYGDLAILDDRLTWWLIKRYRNMELF